MSGTRVNLASCLQSMRVERAELEAFKEQDEYAFYADSHASLRLEALGEDIDMICRARADQKLKDIQSALAGAPTAGNKKQMTPKLVHLRQSFPNGTSCEKAHEIANRIRKIGMVEKNRQFAYVLEQAGTTLDTLGQNFHTHARFYVKGKDTDVSPGKVAKEVQRITKWQSNSTHMVFHNSIHKLTSYMAGHKNFTEFPDKKAKCEMDSVWRQQNNLKKEYHVMTLLP